jgi:Ni,Fe-hydrogenase maturation factor
MKILVFGNSLVEKDNLALKLISNLREKFLDIEFKEFDPTEDLENEIENKKLFLLDVVEGIDKVMIIDDINELKLDKIYSMHDFDLVYNIKLLKKIGKLKEIEIIGIPQNMDEEDAFNEVKNILIDYN